MPRLSINDSEPDKTTATTEAPTSPNPPPPEKPAPPLADQTDGLIDDELKQKSGASALSAFSAFPQNLSFSEQEEAEEIILLLRAHLVTNVPWILITIGSLFVPVIVFPILSAVGLLPSVGIGLSFVVTVFWYLITVTYAFINFLYWYFNVYIVTNERVIDTDWYSIVYRKVSSCQISKIQDVSSTQIGVLSGIFDFGNVDIQTAAEERNFTFEKTPHPQLVAKKIQELMQKEEAQWEHQPPGP